MKKVLFIGNFLSQKSGTMGAIEKLIPHFSSIGIQAITASRIQNKYLRLAQMGFYTLFFRYSIVHIDIYSGNAFKYAALCSKLARLRGKTIIINLRGGMLPELYEKAPKKVNDLFKKADYIITPSLFLQDYFRSKDFKIEYIPNGIDLQRFPYSRKKVKSHSLLWVRAFSDIYCPEIAIETLLLLKKQFPAITLTMIGPDKGKLSSIKLLIDKYNLSTSVSITGAIPNDELYNYYQNHSVFLNTTTYESFGVCVAEAASCGIPIVTNNVGEIPFLWKNEISACLVGNNNPEMYAKHISRIFTDSDFVTQLKENARKEVEKFDRKSIIEQWLKLLR